MKRKVLTMKQSWLTSSVVGIVVVAVMMFVQNASVNAQGDVVRPSDWYIELPDAPSGSEATAGPAPRTADGRPDLSGVWWPGADVPVNRLGVGSSSRRWPGTKRQGTDSEVLFASLYQPWAAARAQTLSEKDDPALRCVPSVIGFAVSLVNQGYVGQIIQSPKFVVLLTETFHHFKIIPTDGRPHRDDVLSSYHGDSVGHWEGDTLVVDTRNFNGQNWVMDHGNVSFYSDALHLVERYRRLDAETLEISTTIEDPKVLTQPWVVPTYLLKLAPFDQIMEVPCTNTQTASLMETS